MLKIILKEPHFIYLILINTLLLGMIHEAKTSNRENPQQTQKKEEKAPFSAREVIDHATTAPHTYEMNYLKSESGQSHVQKVINNINQNNWPKKDNLEGAWTYPATSKYNKSLIADHVSEEYKRFSSMVRELRIIIDDWRYQDLNPTVTEFIGALEANCVPILIHPATWNEFAKARSNYTRKLKSKEEYKFFHNLYESMTQEAKLYNQKDYNLQQIYEKLKIIEKSKFKGISILPMPLEFIKEWVAYETNFVPDEWEIYTDDNFYLLVPHNYIRRLTNNHSIKPGIKIRDFDTGRSLTELELLIGLKIGNMYKININDSEILPYDDSESKIKLFPLEKILINYNDLENNQFQNEILEKKHVYPFVWNIFITGHGNYKLNAEETSQLDAKFLEVKNLTKNLEQLYSSSSLPDIKVLEKRLEHLENVSKEKPGEQNILLKISNIKEIIFNLKRITFVKKEISNKLSSDDGVPYSYNSQMVGLSFSNFIKLLDFFDNKIQTSFVFYETCYAGARNLVFPYMSELETIKKYNYTIATGTSFDTPTKPLSETVEILDRLDGIKFDSRNIKFNDGIGSFKLITQNAFLNKFFESLRAPNPPSFSTIISYIHTTAREREYHPAYQPIIRLPGMETFKVDSIDDRLVKISRITSSVAHLKNGFEIYNRKDDEAKEDKNFKEGIVLSTYYIPTALKFKGGLPKAFIYNIFQPSLPAINLWGYYFKEIAMDVPFENFMKNLLRGRAKPQSSLINIYERIVTQEEENNQIHQSERSNVIIFLNDYTELNNLYQYLLDSPGLKKYQNIKKMKVLEAALFTQGNQGYIEAEIEITYGDDIWPEIDKISIKRAMIEQEKVAYEKTYSYYKEAFEAQAKIDGLDFINLEEVNKAINNKILKMPNNVKVLN